MIKIICRKKNAVYASQRPMPGNSTITQTEKLLLINANFEKLHVIYTQERKLLICMQESILLKYINSCYTMYINMYKIYKNKK